LTARDFSSSRSSPGVLDRVIDDEHMGYPTCLMGVLSRNGTPSPRKPCRIGDGFREVMFSPPVPMTVAGRQENVADQSASLEPIEAARRRA
jgi:hypothetical protein